MSATQPDPAFEALLDFLRRSRGADLTGYKRTSLMRRFQRRMQDVGVTSYSDYIEFLELHPDEFDALFDTLLINVTSFFRDPQVWERLRDELVPAMLAANDGADRVRVWSAGCASGEEAYTLAIVLAEVLGLDAYRERVKIYATDIDEHALATARLGIYSGDALQEVAPELVERYFECSEQRLAFRKDLRRTVVFGRNNLVEDAPISHLDMLVCRNTLMYFNAEAQARIVRNFHFALAPHGLLVLGRSEMMLGQRGLFAPADLRLRIFRRVGPEGLQDRLGDLVNGELVGASRAEEGTAVRDAALEAAVHAQVLVSAAGTLLYANLAARALFGIGTDQFRRPFVQSPIAQQIDGLTGAVEQALHERRKVSVGEVTFRPEIGGERQLDVIAAPLLSNGNTLVGTSVTAVDVTREHALRAEVELSRRDLELAYEELQSTVDELETTNEELQSANEELQTTNEELQSTNEELETMNQELQSTNEELETINDELRDRTGEVNSLNEFLEAILTSLGVGIAVLDAEQRVQVWNRRAEDLWGLRPDEAIDRHFLSLDIGLPVDRLASDLRVVLTGAEERRTSELAAVNRRGREILMRTTVLPLARAVGDGNHPAARGVIVLMEDHPSRDGQA